MYLLSLFTHFITTVLPALISLIFCLFAVLLIIFIYNLREKLPKHGLWLSNISLGIVYLILVICLIILTMDSSPDIMISNTTTNISLNHTCGSSIQYVVLFLMYLAAIPNLFINMYLLFEWDKTSQLKTIVNKFIGLTRYTKLNVSQSMNMDCDCLII
mgnify:CR=1 FL=1